MATPEALESLRQTHKALKEIQVQLRPFVLRLQDKNIDDHSRAQARAAVALAIGTLRYMGARLRGLDQGRSSDDPLRQELNQMRRILVAVQEAEKKRTGANKKESGKCEVPNKEAADKKAITKPEEIKETEKCPEDKETGEKTVKEPPSKRQHSVGIESKVNVESPEKCETKKRKSPSSSAKKGKRRRKSK